MQSSIRHTCLVENNFHEPDAMSSRDWLSILNISKHMVCHESINSIQVCKEVDHFYESNDIESAFSVKRI